MPPKRPYVVLRLDQSMEKQKSAFKTRGMYVYSHFFYTPQPIAIGRGYSGFTKDLEIKRFMGFVKGRGENGRQSKVFTPPLNRRGKIFSLQCVCVCVCLFVCVSVGDQNASQTDEPIWTRVFLNGCLPHWIGPHWNWGSSVEGQGHSDAKSIFSSLFLSLSVTLDIARHILRL